MILELSSGTWVIPDDAVLQFKIDTNGYFVCYSYKGSYFSFRLKDDEYAQVIQNYT
jgi:hypothetical protein